MTEIPEDIKETADAFARELLCVSWFTKAPDTRALIARAIMGERERCTKIVQENRHVFARHLLDAVRDGRT